MSSSGGVEMPWVEKYRPRRLAEVAGNVDVVSRLRVFAKEGGLPNVVMSGPPGCGKTTSMHCLARELLGDKVSEAVLELNASNERGIDVVRGKIKNFAQQKVSLEEGQHKLVILDEADSMTEGAQQAMRRTMELHSRTTRFALACNTSSKIIEPIQSRCAVLRYAKLSEEELLGRLLHVVRAEEVAYEDEGLEAVLFTAQGDMRQALNNLQATVAGFGFVSAENVFKVADEPHPQLLHQMLSNCANGHLKPAQKTVTKLHRLGYSSEDIIGNIFRVCKTHDGVGEALKLAFLKEIAQTHMLIVEGHDSLLQLSALVARLFAAALPQGSLPVLP